MVETSVAKTLIGIPRSWLMVDVRDTDADASDIPRSWVIVGTSVVKTFIGIPRSWSIVGINVIKMFIDISARSWSMTPLMLTMAVNIAV